MARVTGPSIDKQGHYEATELVGRGLYRLQCIEQPESDVDGTVSVKISRDAARWIGRHKLPGETLAAAVERLALSSRAR